MLDTAGGRAWGLCTAAAPACCLRRPTLAPAPPLPLAHTLTFLSPASPPAQPFGPPAGMGGFPGELNPNTAAAAAAAAFRQTLSSSAASGAGMGGSSRPAPATSKWWQDPAATFGPPGDPEVVARQAPLRGPCEVESAPPRAQGPR